MHVPREQHPAMSVCAPEGALDVRVHILRRMPKPPLRNEAAFQRRRRGSFKLITLSLIVPDAHGDAVCSPTAKTAEIAMRTVSTQVQLHLRARIPCASPCTFPSLYLALRDAHNDQTLLAIAKFRVPSTAARTRSWIPLFDHSRLHVADCLVDTRVHPAHVRCLASEQREAVHSNGPRLVQRSAAAYTEQLRRVDERPGRLFRTGKIVVHVTAVGAILLSVKKPYLH